MYNKAEQQPRYAEVTYNVPVVTHVQQGEATTKVRRSYLQCTSESPRYADVVSAYPHTSKMPPNSIPGTSNLTSCEKNCRQAMRALPCNREETTRSRIRGRMCERTPAIVAGLTAITVHKRVSTNWEICRSLSLMRPESSSSTHDMRGAVIATAVRVCMHVGEGRKIVHFSL